VPRPGDKTLHELSRPLAPVGRLARFILLRGTDEQLAISDAHEVRVHESGARVRNTVRVEGAHQLGAGSVCVRVRIRRHEALQDPARAGSASRPSPSSGSWPALRPRARGGWVESRELNSGNYHNAIARMKKDLEQVASLDGRFVENDGQGRFRVTVPADSFSHDEGAMGVHHPRLLERYPLGRRMANTR